jgi:membrane associated rhomboid family serine protease
MLTCPRCRSRFLLHGSVLHLLGNAYVLAVVGPHVEELVGWARYLGLLVLGTLAGDIAHAALEPRTGEVLIGASAGISAALVLYALAFLERA